VVTVWHPMSWLKYPPRWSWHLPSLVLLVLYRLRNNSYGSQIKMSRPWHLDVVSTQTGIQKTRKDFNCDIQEFITVHDTHSFRMIHSFIHSATARNMELPQLGEPRKVQPPSQRRWLTNMDTLENKHGHCLKYTDVWTINSSHTDDDSLDKWTR
jgi:hypothetical protein